MLRCGHVCPLTRLRPCPIDRSHPQTRVVSECDLGPLRSARVETRGNHHRFRENDSRTFPIVMLRGKLTRVVDRLAYHRQGSRRVVACLTDTGQPCVQMDDKIGRPTKFLSQSTTQGVQTPVNLCGYRKRLSVSLLRSDFKTKNRRHSV